LDVDLNEIGSKTPSEDYPSELNLVSILFTIPSSYTSPELGLDQKSNIEMK